MTRFKELTTQTMASAKVNVMGRRTYESIPSKFRPLPNRINVVLTAFSNPSSFPEGVHALPSLDEALRLLGSEEMKDKVESVFVIGGAQVYREALQHPACQRIYCTQIVSPDFECDVFFPKIEEHLYEVSAQDPRYLGKEQTEGDVVYKFVLYTRR